MAGLKQKSALISAALLIAVPFVCGHEGESLKSYEDVAGVWTICNGETHGIKPGMTTTKEQCSEMTQSRVGQFMADVANKITVEVSPRTLAAHTSFAYNIGIGGYTRSSTLRETNRGNIAQGCRNMTAWHTAGGKDCLDRENNCYGLIQRRADEVNLCLSGVE